MPYSKGGSSYHAQRYLARKQAGLCTYCGRHPARENRTRCDECAEKESARGKGRKRPDAAARYQANKPRYRDWHYRRRYGITLADYEALLQKQGGGCAVCHRLPKPKRRLDVDHDHITGTVRGLLCASCNTAIGHLREQPSTFAAALAYLKQGE